MAATTINVPSDLRDVLKSQARAHGRTLIEHLWVLAADEEKRGRFEDLRRAVAENPPDEEYLREQRTWQGTVWS